MEKRRILGWEELYSSPHILEGKKRVAVIPGVDSVTKKISGDLERIGIGFYVVNSVPPTEEDYVLDAREICLSDNGFYFRPLSDRNRLED